MEILAFVISSISLYRRVIFLYASHEITKWSKINPWSDSLMCSVIYGHNHCDMYYFSCAALVCLEKLCLLLIFYLLAKWSKISPWSNSFAVIY